MAKKRSSRKKKSGQSLFMWLLLTLFSGGGMGGYLFPDLPVVGQLVQQIKSTFSNGNRPTPGQVVDAIRNGQQGLSGNPAGGTRQVPTQLAAARQPSDRFLIASYNIQVFGNSKLGKPDVMAVLVDVIRQFDLIAIQEIRSKDDHILPTLVQALNATGRQYDFVIGPRIGRTVSTEQYAYVYDQTRLEYDPSSVVTMVDQNDLLHREPLLTRFRTRTQAPDKAFTFWMVNIHTDPDEVKEEVDALADVFQVMLRARPDEDDVILLGDLNANEKQFGRLGKIPGIQWVVSGTTTNTRRNKCYDNILVHGPSTGEYTGRWGVFDVEESFRLTRDQALKVSDHMPVWAEFSIWEAPRGNGVAAGPTTPLR